MPFDSPLQYHEFPDLHVVLDFLGRCDADGDYMVVRYQRQHELHAGQRMCRQLNIQPQHAGFTNRHEETSEDLRLQLSCSDWRALSGNAMVMLTGELRMLFKAVSDAKEIVPIQWRSLPLTDSALVVWGRVEGMVALPFQAASAYLEARYPVHAPQRRLTVLIDNAGQASRYKNDHVLGFLVAMPDGTRYLACQGDDWRREVASSAALLEHHLSLMLRIGLQRMATGSPSHLSDMCWALGHAGDVPLLVTIDILLRAYVSHNTVHPSGPDPFREQLVDRCIVTYQQWRQESTLPLNRAATLGRSAAPSRTRITHQPLIAEPLSRSLGLPGHRQVPLASARLSAFHRVTQPLHAVGPRGEKRKRGSNDVPDVAPKRPRKFIPVITISAPETAGATIDYTIPAYRPANETGSEHPARGWDQPTTASPAVVSRPSMPDWAAWQDTRHYDWLAPLRTVRNETTLFRPAASIVRVPAVQANPVAPGLAPVGVQIFFIPDMQARGPRL